MSLKVYCPYCGTDIKTTDAEFCPKCGAYIKEVTKKAVPTVVAPRQVVQPLAVQPAVCAEYGHAYTGGMTGLKWLIIILTACTIIIPIVLYLVWNKKRCLRCGMKEP